MTNWGFQKAQLEAFFGGKAPRLAGQHFKAEVKPTVGDQQSFEDAVKTSGLTDEQQPVSEEVVGTSGMESFEQIRTAALQLHNKVVAAGASAISPMSLMTEALKELDLELFCFPLGDPALKGARALFDEQSGTIFCEDTDDPSEKVELVTHEIGHSILHTGAASCTQTDIDASRSEESAPVGLQRVEDYGVRERRELQANVFAREFLLPKPVASAIYS